MEHPTSSSSVLLLRCLLLLFLAPQIQCDDLINKTCRKTPDYNLCVSSLQSNPKSLDADVQGLADIMANITLSNATDTLSYIQILVSQTKDPMLEQSLAYCAEVYIPVVQYILPQAINVFSKGGYGFAKYGISYAADEVGSCTVSKKSLLADRKQLMLDLCGVTVAIINILLKK
uniref:Pectinesterase inhibitor domain-containing protein n=1 Tax=Salix viminalis TaxID=40686 RepID=A0A6N2LUI1_SALVM